MKPYISFGIRNYNHASVVKKSLQYNTAHTVVKKSLQYNTAHTVVKKSLQYNTAHTVAETPYFWLLS